MNYLFEKKIKTENLAYWFFRLNGCLNIVNFLIHHEIKGQEGTDVDILAVRFPFRQELAYLDEPMKDHHVFISDGKIDLIIAEIKRGRCKLNGPWTKSERRNMQRVLQVIGAFPENIIDEVADSLYHKKSFENETHRCRLFAIGETKNNDPGYMDVIQITWDEILDFIFDRFSKYQRYKTQQRQWDNTGQTLFSLVNYYYDQKQEFKRTIIGNLESAPNEVETEDFSNLISLEEASELSGLSSAHLRRLVGNNILWGKKIGRNWITSRQSIQDYINQEHHPGKKTQNT